MKKITQFLKQDKNQRISYIVLLICWIIIFLNPEARIHIYPYTENLPLIFIFPVILLVLQIMFNNRIIWMIILACFILYTLREFFQQYTLIVVDYHRDYSHTFEWNAATIFQLIAGVLFYTGINWFIYNLKPIKK